MRVPFRCAMFLTCLMVAATGCQARSAPAPATAPVTPAQLGSGGLESLQPRTEPMFTVPPAIQDTVILLEFIIGVDGRPERSSIRLIDSAGRSRAYPDAPAFEDEVRNAVAQWQYRPAQMLGRPVRVLVRQPIIRRRPGPSQ